MWEGPAHSGRCYPLAGCPGLYKKSGCADHGEQVSRQCSFMAGLRFSSCIPVPPLSSCPKFPSQWTVSWNKLLPSKLLLVLVFVMALESEVEHSRPLQHKPSTGTQLIVPQPSARQDSRLKLPFYVTQVTKHTSKFVLWNYHVFLFQQDNIPHVPNSVSSGVYPILRAFPHPFKSAAHRGVSCYSHAAWWRCVQFVRHESCSFWIPRSSLPSPSKAYTLSFLSSSQHLTVLTSPLLFQHHLFSPWCSGATKEAREQEVHESWNSKIMMNVFASFSSTRTRYIVCGERNMVLGELQVI